MPTTTLIRTASLAALIFAAGLAPQAPAIAADAHAQRAGDPGGGERRRLALHSARRRQVGRHRPAARHQGRAGRRSQDRQCGDPLLAPRLHDRRQGRADQHLLLRRQGPPDRRLRHRRHPRSQRPARRAQARAAGHQYPGRRHGRGRRCCPARRRAPTRRSRPTTSPSRLVGDGVKVVNAITVRGTRRGDDQGHGRGSAARRGQAARHRPQRQPQLRHRGGELQHQQSVFRHRVRRCPTPTSPAPSRTSPPRCAPWSAPA